MDSDNKSSKSVDSSQSAVGSKNNAAIDDRSAFAEATADKQVTENMEVHKHPHHVMHRKKWGEYLLEFFMLFLAVFLGFLAENQREHYVEREREKQFINSLVRDVEMDTAQIN